MTTAPPSRGCYGVQVLVAGRRKRWRDEVSNQIRRAGFQATACDSGVDALTVLVLGLPVDVLVADAALDGTLCCTRLAHEARALRPGLRIVLTATADDATPEDIANRPSDAFLLARDLRDGSVASTVWEALASRPA